MSHTSPRTERAAIIPLPEMSISASCSGHRNQSQGSGCLHHSSLEELNFSSR